LVPRVRINYRHAHALGRTHGHTAGIEGLEAEHVDPEMIRRCPLPMKGINAATRAEEMPRPVGIPLIDRQQILTAEHGELVLVHFRHQSVLLRAQRAIAGRELADRSVDPECYCAAVARALVDRHVHLFPSRCSSIGMSYQSRNR